MQEVEQLQQIVEVNRVRVSRDECGDPMIEGTRGHLYLSGDEICLMALNARVSGFNDQQLAALGGRLWTGSRWFDERRRAHRDVEIKGIPPENVGKAIKLLRCKPTKPLTEKQRAVLAANAFKIGETRDKPPGGGT